MMYDENKVIPMIIVFVVLVTFPLWYNLGKAAAKPDPKIDTPVIQADEGQTMSRTQGHHDHHPHEDPGSMAL